MASTVDTSDACEGMTTTIFEQMQEMLEQPLRDALAPLQQLPENVRPDIDYEVNIAKDSWHALAQSIATGVIEYLTGHMKIVGIETFVSIDAPVTGSTGDPVPLGAAHSHRINLSATQKATFAQSDDGTGHIKWQAQ